MKMNKYRLYCYDVEIFKNWWIFPLAFQLHLNNPWHRVKNFEITINFLCFHVSWLFKKVESED